MTCDEILRHFEAPEEPPPPRDDETPTLAQVEWEHINRVLEDCKGNISMAAHRLALRPRHATAVPRDVVGLRFLHTSRAFATVREPKFSCPARARATHALAMS